VAAGQSIALEHRYTAAMVNERFVLRDDSGAMLAAQTRGTEVLASDAELSALLAPLSLARAPAACVPDPDPIACCPACPQPPCCPAGDETGTFTLRPVPIDLALDGQTLRLLSRQRGPLSTYDAFLAESATVDTSSCASAFPDDLRLTVIAT
jgi:hypothetical protein